MDSTQSSRRSIALRTLDFRFLAFRTMRWYLVLSHQLCSTLLQQPGRANLRQWYPPRLLTKPTDKKEGFHPCVPVNVMAGYNLGLCLSDAQKNIHQAFPREQCWHLQAQGRQAFCSLITVRVDRHSKDGPAGQCNSSIYQKQNKAKHKVESCNVISNMVSALKVKELNHAHNTSVSFLYKSL